MAQKLFIVIIVRFILSDTFSAGIIISHRGKNLTDVPEGRNASGYTRTLDLSENRINQLQDLAFRQYTSLATIYLNNNKLQGVSSSAFNRTKITLLALSDNELSCLPDLSALQLGLKTLIAARNNLHKCLKGIRYQVKFDYLHNIILSANGLRHLDAMTILWTAPYLRHVNLYRNQLKQVPNFLRVSPKLQSFKLGRNPIICSCEIRWLKQTNNDGISTICMMTGPLFGKSWKSLTHSDIENYCQPFTTFNSSGNIRIYIIVIYHKYTTKA